MPRDQKRKLKQRIRRELGKTTALSEEEEASIYDVWSLSLQDRWKLYRLWVMRYRTEMRTRALQSERVYQNAAERLAEIRMRQHLCVLREARVIGMTTTGAAKYRQALQEVRPRLVIVEEAAEVLEAHIITTLSRACQHLILIGDHQQKKRSPCQIFQVRSPGFMLALTFDLAHAQLRPSATVYELAKNFNLEVSLFERLVKLDFPYVRLNYQHRMRPEIARLLTPHIYKELENHPSVLEYDNIKGILSNLFFVEHEFPEEEIQDGRSRQNRHEALFVVALCQYLLYQEYEASQITILTTYTGQLHCLRKMLPASRFAGIKVHVVDKYQGEENDIVLLSLVRSNLEGRVGFLQIANRVCVALSRAKKGLYCIGNMSMLGKVHLWSSILCTLREHGQVGRHLTLCCQNHPETRTLVSCAEDFKQAPEGGCRRSCNFRLPCGHVCTRACHPYDAEHRNFECMKACPKVLCKLGHRCPALCYQECPDCPVLVQKVIPSCQHEQMVPCHQDPIDFICKEPCKKLLKCGHPCVTVCGMPCTMPCMVQVTVELDCGHRQQVSCHLSGPGVKPPMCKVPCRVTLKCGHPCLGTCHRCHQGRVHQACAKPCHRLLVCSHLCREPCTDKCLPCQVPCHNRCVHSVCPKSCGQPCAPCAEPCAWQCPHQRCTKLCHEPCDRPPCNQPCDKILDCGHPCIGLCGDTCPEKCRICDHDEVTDIFFGTEDEPLACFIQLEDCGHIFESTALDKYMNQGEEAVDTQEQRAIRLKECPKCRTPIRRNLRYGAHINRCLAEIEKVKAVLNGCPEALEKQREVLLDRRQKMDIVSRYDPRKYGDLAKRLTEGELNLQSLWMLENEMTFLERLDNFLEPMLRNKSSVHWEAFASRLEEFLGWLEHPSQRFLEQQISDLQNEAQRLTYLAKVNECCDRAKYKLSDAAVKTEVQDLRKILEGTSPFTEKDEMWVKETLERLEKKLPGGLGINEEERVMILQAMSLPKGHWYKCPNGHVYAIGDCGGAMEKRKCPDCPATIGGASHTLSEGNTVASEMDGAEHAAWSEGANILNFDLNRLRL